MYQKRRGQFFCQPVYVQSDTSSRGGGGALLGILGGSETNKQSVYPLSDQNGAKTLPDGAAYTYMADIRE